MSSKWALLDALFRQNKSLPYQSNLSDAEKMRFSNWVDQNNVPVDLSPTSDYDMPGFFKAAEAGRASSGISPIDGQVHYTDQFKTPMHDTFSNESQYSDESDPHWEGNSMRNNAGDLSAIELPGGEILKTKRGLIGR